MTWTNRTEPLYAAIEEARDAFAEMAQAEVARRLRVLCHAFPRHRFTFSHGNGSSSVEVAPAILGQTAILGDGYMIRNRAEYARAYKIAPEAFNLLRSELGAIDAIVDEAEDVMCRSLGEVTP